MKPVVRAGIHAARSAFVRRLRERIVTRAASDAPAAAELLAEFSALTREEQRALFLHPQLPDAVMRALPSDPANTSYVGMLGTAAVLSDECSQDKTRLVTIARSSWPVSRSAQLILHDYPILRDLARLRYGMGFAQSASVYLQKIFGRLSAQLTRGVSPALLTTESEAYRWGPVEVLLNCAVALPLEPMSSVECEELDSVMHDTVGPDTVSLRDTIPYGLRRGKLDYVRNALRGASSYIWGNFLRSSVSPEVLYGDAHGVQVVCVPLLDKAFIRHGVPLADLALSIRELVRNGVKYRDPAKPERYVRVEWDAKASELRIVDNGIGIQDVEQIWAWGTRERRNDAPGTGFGLYSVKRRLARMGWSIAVASVVGVGSTFTLTAPAGDVYR